MPHIFDVSELTTALKSVVEGEFPFVWVRGQVGNLARPSSGHVYFTLKDRAAVLPVVWFSSSRREIEAGGVDPVTGEVFENGRSLELSEGLEVLCAGRLSIYQPRGTYQLIAEHVQEQGLGELYERFEAMKRKLAGLGCFDAGRKRAIPESPRRVAVVTSKAGAAIRDFLRVASERGAGAEIRIYDTIVQGREAGARIAAAIDKASAHGWAELIVLIRGGGSLEDLWAFNEEEVAAAVFRSAVPVLTGVGHEVDTTIADLTADLRAATPSHAAQTLWTERRFLFQAVDELSMDLEKSLKGVISRKNEALAGFERALAWFSPARRIERAAESLAREIRGLDSAMSALVQRKAGAIEAAERGVKAAFGPGTIEMLTQNLESIYARLGRAAGELARRKGQALALAEAGLAAVDPMGPLKRGYALVTVEKTGKYLRSVGDAGPGDRLDVAVADGSLPATVAKGKSGA